MTGRLLIITWFGIYHSALKQRLINDKRAPNAVRRQLHRVKWPMGHHMARRALGDSEGTPEQGDPVNEPLASSVVCQLPPLELPVDHPNRDEPVRVCVEVTTNNDPDQATDDCQLFTYFDD